MSPKKIVIIGTLIVMVVCIGSVGYFIKQTSLFETIVGTDSSSPITSPVSETEDIDLARVALITYFDLLKKKEYTTAVFYHGSGYEILESWNPASDFNDYAVLLKNGCESNGWQCLGVKKILQEQKISSSEFRFSVQFEKPEWSTGDEMMLTRGSCCGEGGNEEVETEFDFIVKKTKGNFIVMTPPVYIP